MSDIFTTLASDTSTLYEDVVRDGLKNRILIFNEDVTDDMLENYIYYIMKWNLEDKDLPTDSRKHIKMVFNSNGGDVMMAFGMIDTIKASATPIIGIGIGLVASAAYYIFISCHTRIAFKNTIFLQHDGSIGVSNSNRKAKETVAFLERIDDRIEDIVLENTTIDRETYEDSFDVEYYMFAEEAKQNGAVDMIIGEDINMVQALQ